MISIRDCVINERYKSAASLIKEAEERICELIKFNPNESHWKYDVIFQHKSNLDEVHNQLYESGLHNQTELDINISTIGRPKIKFSYTFKG